MRRKKKKRLSKRLKRTGLNLLIATLFCSFFVVVHEHTHGTIYEHFGCDNVTYGYETGYFYTDCEDETFRCNDACKVSHLNNEIVGYTVMPFVIVGLVTLGSIERSLRK